jgi:hypothetical protein
MAEWKTLNITEHNYVATLPLFPFLTLLDVSMVSIHQLSSTYVIINMPLRLRGKKTLSAYLEKTKPDADVIMVARFAISELQ